MTGAAGVVIVGASLAGLTTAEALRAEGYAGRVTLIGEEDRAPYNRPPLSKQVLSGAWSIEQTTMRDATQLDEIGVLHLRGRRASGVDVEAHTVTVGGERLPYDHLVAATGVVARRLPNPRRLRGIHSLRTADDALRLQQDLLGSGRVAVVGAGVLGCEIASAARSSGRDVTLIGRASGVRFGRTGEHLSPMIAQLLQDNGVRMRMGVDVVETEGRDTVSTVRLSDGSLVPADLVIGAIGCTPVVDWLSGTGIDISDGVLCDADGVAAPDLYAVGDVARWVDPLTGLADRVEHQATAIERANAVARLIATGERSEAAAAFFWSEIFGNRILVHGRLDPTLPLTVLAGDPADRRFVGATIRDDRPTGLVGWNMPREFRQERARLIHPAADTVGTLKGSTLA
jgi:NADPH-dependent 2,4-dienoyl-CoA reductase/sulfur reductase-like enzyme